VRGLLADVVFLVVAMALVVSMGTPGALPGPLWLWLSSGTGLMVFITGFVIIPLRILRRENADNFGIVPGALHHFVSRVRP
jgi:hypothetical protein